MKSRMRVAVVVVVALAVSAAAQVHGVPASVTSPGSSGRSMTNGVPASVTSLGPNGWNNAPCCSFPTPLIPSAMGFRDPAFNVNVGRNGLELGRSFHLNPQGHHQRGAAIVPYYVGVPYAVPVYPEGYEQAVEEQQPEEQPEPPAPTIFEHRSTVQRRPDPALRQEAIARPEPPPEPQPAREQDPTLLIFKDGSRVEIMNFAVVGDAIIELSPEYRKIPLSDLNLPATMKENDARGTDFHVPGHKGS